MSAPDLHQVVYVSTATELMGAEALAAILDVARANNACDGLTGLLVYVDGTFFQALEGPRRAVEALLDRIRADPRHRDFTVLIAQDVAARGFPQWSMECRSLPCAEAERNGWFQFGFATLDRLRALGADPSAGVRLADRFVASNL